MSFAMVDSTSLSNEELTWLKATAIIDSPPIPPPKEDDIFMPDLSTSTATGSVSNNFSFKANSPPRLRHVLTPTSRTANGQTSPTSSFKGSAAPLTPLRNSTRPTDSPRSEWIYRRPKSPASGRLRSANPSPYSRPQPRPFTGYATQASSLSRAHSNASTRTTRTVTLITPNPSLVDDSHTAAAASSSLPSGPFWSTILRPRSRSERSIPLLKTIPSQSQIVLTPPDFSSTVSRVSSPKPMSARPPSFSSTLSSVSTSNSPSSSRSESPVTPVSFSSSPYGRHRRHNSYHRRHRTQPESDTILPPLSSSCPPSKSILTRTSSVSTKDSSHTVNKSVKFAAIPIVHYASAGYWDLETIDSHGSNMGINIDGMDMDDSFTSYPTRIGDDELGAVDIARLRELACATPTPEREREKSKGLKRLMSLNRKPVTTTVTTTSVATAHKPSSTTGRPVISTPYALGAYPTLVGMQSTVSLQTSNNSRKENGAAGSALDLASQGSLPLRSAPSCESFRSTKSTAARSVRSMGSVKSTSSTRGFRAWLVRTMGWTES